MINRLPFIEFQTFKLLETTERSIKYRLREVQ